MIERLNIPAKLGHVEVTNRVFLAPLAGVSDIPFRRICQELGAGLTYVEMLMSNGIEHQAHRTMKVARRHSSEKILGVQITGAGAAAISNGVRRLAQLPFDVVDVNMGCPVRKIVSRGCGSALLRDPVQVSEVVQKTLESTSCPVSVKIRLGFSRNEMNFEENAARIAAAGAAMLTIHGRARSESYMDPVDYDAISKGFQAARAAAAGPILLVGNGNVFGQDEARMMIEKTGCDALMISRGALGNPWIFNRILGRRNREPTIEEWRNVVLRHLGYHEQHYASDRIAAVLFRKHLLWYLSGFPGVRKVRRAGSVVMTLDEARRLVVSFAASLPPDLRRYADRELKRETRISNGYDPKYEMDRKLDRGIASEETRVGERSGPSTCHSLASADRIAPTLSSREREE